MKQRRLTECIRFTYLKKKMVLSTTHMVKIPRTIFAIVHIIWKISPFYNIISIFVIYVNIQDAKLMLFFVDGFHLKNQNQFSHFTYIHSTSSTCIYCIFSYVYVCVVYMLDWINAHHKYKSSELLSKNRPSFVGNFLIGFAYPPYTHFFLFFYSVDLNSFPFHPKIIIFYE